MEGKELSVRRQCELLGVNRSSLYYQAKPANAYTELLMQLIDEEYTRHPFYGTRRMRAYLKRLGHDVNRKRLRRLYAKMGLEAIYAKPRLSLPNKEHKIFPYLLEGVNIDCVNHVWSTDITYIRLKQGFVYLMAIIDWYSRYVLDFEISTSLEANFCIEALARVLSKGKCDIFNTDQGSQFTSTLFVNMLLSKKIQVSMDGKGRALDNVFVERLWRSVKYECVYLQEFETVAQAKNQLKNYFIFYNNERPHQSLNYKTPREIYFS